MKVILIPCSKEKCGGGDIWHPGNSTGLCLLKSETRRVLQDAREKLRRLLPDVLDGPEFGDCLSAFSRYLPAYKRYKGKLYAAASLTERDLRNRSSSIFIISALYGFLSATDLIQNYNLQMKDSITAGGRRMTVKRFWRDVGLGRIVDEALEAAQATEVHCLLSIPYSEALNLTPQAISRYHYHTHNELRSFGTGSNHRRGLEVRKILNSIT